MTCRGTASSGRFLGRRFFARDVSGDAGGHGGVHRDAGQRATSRPVASDACYADSTGQNRTIAWRYDGSELGGDDTILVLFSGEPSQRDFTLPWTGVGKTTWCRVTDTASWAEGAMQVDLAARSCVGGENTIYGTQGRSLVVLVAH